MEINFQRQSPVTEHLTSAFEKDSILLLNGKSKTTSLIYSILREFIRIKDKSCLLVQPSHRADFKELEKFFSCLTNTYLHDMDSYDKTTILEFKKIPKVLTTLMLKTVIDLLKDAAFLKSLCLVLIDLTEFEVLDLETLEKIVFFCNACKSNEIRIVTLCCLENYLDDHETLQDFLENKIGVIPLHQISASDSISFCNNGNTVQLSVEFYDENPQTDAQNVFISRYLESICEFLAKVRVENPCSENQNHWLQMWTDLKVLYKGYGLLALCQGLLVAENLIERWKDEIGGETPMLRFMESQIQIIDRLAVNYKTKNCEEHSNINQFISPCFRKFLDLIKKKYISLESQSQGFSGTFSKDSLPDVTSLYCITESIMVAESLYNLLGHLQKTAPWLVPPHIDISVLEIPAAALCFSTSNCTFKSQVTSNGFYVSFNVPADYKDFLRHMKFFDGRITEAIYIIASTDLESLRRLQNFKEIQRQLTRRISSYIDPCLAEKAMNISHDELPPFTIPGSDSVYAPETAIRVINRYCKFLSAGCSAESKLSVRSSTEVKFDESKETIAAQTILIFPVRSLLKNHIKGPLVACPRNSPHSDVYVSMSSRIAACAEACKALHAAGELDNNMLPSRKERTARSVNLAESSDDVIALSQKKLYHKEIPQLLTNSYPNAEQTFYLYVVKNSCLDTSKFLGFNKYLGFCTTKQLPKVPSFLVYNRGNKVMLTVSEVSCSTRLDKNSLGVLSRFSDYVVAHVLRYEQPHAQEDRHANRHGLLWTVLGRKDSSYEIDYEFLESDEFSRDRSRPDKLERLNFYTETSVLDAVVIPTHRIDSDNLYYVDTLCDDMSVDDPFPDATVARNYIEYFKNKYNIELTPGQLLLKLFPVHRNLNFLKPRREEKSDVSSHYKSKQNTYLPAELCGVHPIPKHLWEQILVIPVLIYRLSRLLHVYELQMILTETLGLSEAFQEVDLSENIMSSLMETPEIIMMGDGFQSAREGKNGGIDGECHENRGSTECYSHKYVNKLSGTVIDSSAADLVTDSAYRYCFSGIERAIESIHDKGCRNFAFGEEVENRTTVTRCCELDQDHYESCNWQSKVENDCKTSNFGSPQAVKGRHWQFLNRTHCKKAPSLSSLLVTFTTANANDVFHHERWEFLGDAFLNAFVIIELFLHYANESEHVLSQRKSVEVSNKMLFGKGQCLGLWRYAVDEQFDYKSDPMVLSILGRTKCDVCEDRASKRSDCFQGVRAKNVDREDVRFKISAKSKGFAVSPTLRRKRLFCKAEECVRLHDRDSELEASNSCYEQSECEGSGYHEDADIDSIKPSKCFATSIRKKAIADSVEALIGLFYLCGGESMAVEVMKLVGFDVCCIPRKSIDKAVAERGIEKTMTERGIENTMTDRIIKNTMTDRGIEKTMTERGIEKTMAEKGIEKTMAERGIEKTMTERGIEKTMTDRSIENTMTDRGMENSRTDRGIKNTMTDRGMEKTMAEKGIEKTMTESGIEKSITEMYSEKVKGTETTIPNRSIDMTTLEEGFDKLATVGCIERRGTERNTDETMTGRSNGSMKTEKCNKKMRGNSDVEKIIKEKGFDDNTGIEFNWEASQELLFDEAPLPLFVMNKLVKFEKQIGYEFNNKELLYEAFLHKTYLRKLACTTYCNQRQEFLGDSLLTFLVTRHLCCAYPRASNAELTIMRSVVVNSQTYATVALLNDFHKYLLFVSSELASAIQLCDERIRSRAVKEKLWLPMSVDDLYSYHINKEYKLQEIKAPKDLDDVFESVAAAVYLDCHNIETVWNCYYPMLKDVLDSLPRSLKRQDVSENHSPSKGHQNPQ